MGIVSTIGGEDSIRMLPFLDYSVIRQNPKVFLGYSDSTVTHFAFLKAGVTSFYGPSLMAGFDENGGLLTLHGGIRTPGAFRALAICIDFTQLAMDGLSHPGTGPMKSGIRRSGSTDHAQGGGGFRGADSIAVS